MATGGKQVQASDVDPKGAPEYFKDSLNDLGIQEWVIKDKRRIPNPSVQRIIAKGGGGSKFDCIDQPWCAWYQNGKLEYQGIPGTKSGMARSFLKWGKPVEFSQARKGDIVILWRGLKDDGVTGHVGQLVELNEKHFTLLGGNQGDKVSIEKFSRYKNGRDRILGIRRPRHWTESRKVRAAAGAAVLQAADVTTNLVISDEPAKPAIKAATKAVEFLNQSQPSVDVISQYRPWITGVVALLTIALLGYVAWRNFADQRDGKP